MARKSFQTSEKEPIKVVEPLVEYDTTVSEFSTSDKWNPNVPFHGTQEEWWDHFHQIEQGNFMSLEECNKRFDAWKKEYLAKKFKENPKLLEN